MCGQSSVFYFGIFCHIFFSSSLISSSSSSLISSSWIGSDLACSSSSLLDINLGKLVQVLVKAFFPLHIWGTVSDRQTTFNVEFTTIDSNADKQSVGDPICDGFLWFLCFNTKPSSLCHCYFPIARSGHLNACPNKLNSSWDSVVGFQWSFNLDFLQI